MCMCVCVCVNKEIEFDKVMKLNSILLADLFNYCSVARSLMVIATIIVTN